MTILDTFYLSFKTDIPKEAGADITKLDKQLDDLAKKGKKRSEDENKQYEVLKKQRKELLDGTKQQQRETDKLRDSFAGMIEGAVGAVTAYASFGALKSGLVDANNLNASLLILQKTYGQNAREVKAYGAAVERSGIKADVLYNFVAQEGAEAASKSTPFDFKRLLKNLHENVKNLSPLAAQRQLQQIPGGSALAPFLQQSDADFNKAIGEGFDKSGTDSDFKAALENQEAVAKTQQAFGKIATQIDTQFHDAIKLVTDDLQGLAHALEGHPNVAAAVGGGLALGTSFGIYKALGWLGRLVSGGGAAAAAGEGVAGASAGSVAAIVGSGIGLTWGAGAIGEWIGGKLRSKPSPGAASPGKQASIAFWESQGYTPAQAAAWAANEQAESSYNPRAQNGSHSGIFQWSSSRRAKILAATGIDILTASHDEQLKAAAWEAKQMGLGPLGLPTSSSGAAAAISNKFEVPSTTPYGLLMEAQKRANIADNIYNQIPSIGSSARNSNRTVNVKVGDVTVHTQATDAAGIAQGFSSEMKNQLRMLASNVDDGEFA